jgi:predicted transcriptional regulator
MTAESPTAERGPDSLLRWTTEIVAAYVAENGLGAGEVANLIGSVHQTLAGLGEPPPAAERRKPAVSIGRSVQHEYIVCLEDGKRLKMLKRYLRARFDLSPEEYRRRWGLPADYPMVAPVYAARRSDFAKKIGLGKGVRRSVR